MSGLKEVGGHGIPDTSTRDGTRRRRPCEAATHRTESGGAAREVPMHPAGQASGHAGSGMSVHCWRFQQACAAFVFEPVPRAIAWTFERMGAVDQL
jgi:hypothetical protein